MAGEAVAQHEVGDVRVLPDDRVLRERSKIAKEREKETGQIPNKKRVARAEC